jgi:hypothetical protein
MTRFFFDTDDSGKRMRDEEGTQLASLEEARAEALTTLAGIAKDELPDGDHRDFSITIRDETGREYLTATLSLRVTLNDRSGNITVPVLGQ